MIRILQHLFFCEDRGDQEYAIRILDSTQLSKAVPISWLTRKQVAKCVSNFLVRIQIWYATVLGGTIQILLEWIHLLVLSKLI